MRCRAIVSILSFLFLVITASGASNPVPFLSSPLQPSAVIPGSGGFTLTVNGSNFISGATVNWNGSARTTTFVSSSQLTATILAADVASAGTFSVTVRNPAPGGVSNFLYFEVANPITNISFAAPANLSLGYDLKTTQPAVYTGDFNNDGKLDLLVAPLNSGLLDFSVLLGNGNGTFAAPVRYSAPGITSGYLQNVVVGDFNGDGKPDVFVSFVNTGATPPFQTQYTMFFGNGDGTFTGNGVVNSISSIDHALTADFNKDGHLDIAGVCTTNGIPQVVSVCILNGDGTGKFTQTGVYVPMGGSGTFDGVAIGDFNRDGILDFAISDVSENQVGLFIVLGNANGTYSAGGGVYAGNGAVSSAGGGIAVADLNGDGFLDLVMAEVDTVSCPGPGGTVTCQTAFLTSFLGNGDGTFQVARTGPAFTPSAGPLTPIVADLNGDGNPDIVTQNQVLLLTNSTNSHVSVTAPFNILAVGDFNGDGKADLIGPGSDSFHLGEALQVSPTPDFSGSANPAYQNVPQATTAAYPITITPTDGFAGTVQFAVSGLPAGTAATFNPATVTGGGNTVLSITTSLSTPTGLYNISITATSGTLSHSGGVQLAVGPPGTDFTDFTGSVSPSYVRADPTVNPTAPGIQIQVVPIRGFNSPVNFSVSGLPSGATASFSPNLLIGGSGTVVLTLSANTSVPLGTYPLTITATGGGHTHTSPVGFNVGPAGASFGDFTGSVTPQSQTISAGSSANYTVTVVSLYGFSGGVSLSATNLPPGATLLGNPIVSGGGGTAVMSIRTSAATPVGTYAIGIQGNASNVSGPLVHGTTVSLTVTAPTLASIAVTPANALLALGFARSFTATATYTNGATLDITNNVSWTSSNTSVATISSSGVATGVATGSTTISAASGSINGSATLMVVNAANTIIPTANMTIPRESATATPLGNGLVLIAGGNTAGGAFANSAELYNPATGAFTPTGNLQFARAFHTATLLNNGKVLIAGGFGNTLSGGGFAGGLVNTAELYDPTTGTFSTTGMLNVGRQGHTATLLPNGKVLVAGGESGGLATSASAELYDPATGLFTLTGSLPSGRTRHSATLLNNGTVLLAGGQNFANNAFTVLSSALLYDPSAGTFTAAGSMTYARFAHTATLLNNGKVLVFGGTNDSGDLTTFEIYDPATQTFGSSTSTPQQHAMHSATLLPNGLVFIAGGQATYPNISTMTEVIDPVALTANIGPSLSEPRENQTATLLNNGTVLLAGGQNHNTPSGGFAPLSSADLFFPPSSNVVNLLSIRVSPVNSLAVVGSTTQFAAVGMYSDNSTQNITNSVVWTSSNTSVATISATGLAAASATGQATITASQAGINGSTTLTVVNTPTASIVLTANLTTPRLSHTATLLNNGKVLIVGGNNHLGPNNSYQSLASAEVYDPASGTFTPTGSLQHVRTDHSAILLNNGKVLIVGGVNSTTGSLVTVAEVYDPATGSFSPTGSLGTGRYSAAVRMLPTGKVLVLGGSGIGVNYVLPVEVYDPAAGNFQTVDTLPFQRSSFGTVRLNNGTLLIAGGFDNSTNADSTSASLYDLANGGFTSTGSMQVAREGKATLLNSGKALVFGGFLLNGAGPGSFEIYDPTTQAFGSLTSVPQGRFGETDTLLSNGELFLVGGNDNSNSFAKPIAASLLIDPVGLTSAAGPSLNVTREFHTATLMNNGQVLIAGGFLNNDINSAELYTTSSLNLPNLTSIAVTPAAASLATGAAQRFIATGTFSDGSMEQLAVVIWSSSDPGIAQISNDSTNPGAAIGIAPGTITITATVGSVRGSTTLTVTP